MSQDLGCRFPVSSADFWLCLNKYCGEADRGRLAGQRQEFKNHRKSTVQLRIGRKGTARIDSKAQKDEEHGTEMKSAYHIELPMSLAPTKTKALKFV